MAATPSGILFSEPRDKPLSATGQFQAGCYRYFYNTGTLVQTQIYADGGLTTPLSQPVTAASDGRFPAIYLNPATIYRVQLYNAANVLLDDVDPYVLSASTSNNTFTGVLTGFAAGINVACKYVSVGGVATVVLNYTFSNDTGTSNSTSFGMTGIPATISSPYAQFFPVQFIEDNGGTTNGSVSISGTILTFYKGSSGVAASWTASGTKGLPDPITFTYSLI